MRLVIRPRLELKKGLNQDDLESAVTSCKPLCHDTNNTHSPYNATAKQNGNWERLQNNNMETKEAITLIVATPPSIGNIDLPGPGQTTKQRHPVSHNAMAFIWMSGRSTDGLARLSGLPRHLGLMGKHVGAGGLAAQGRQVVGSRRSARHPGRQSTRPHHNWPATRHGRTAGRLSANGPTAAADPGRGEFRRGRRIERSGFGAARLILARLNNIGVFRLQKYSALINLHSELKMSSA